MVAVLGQKVVRCAQKLLGRSAQCNINLILSGKGKSLQYFASKRAARGFGLGFGPVNTSYTALIMATIRIFFTTDDHAGVKQRRTNSPKNR